MRIIAEGFLVETARKYPKAGKYLDAWRTIVRAATWKQIRDVKKTYVSVDTVTVKSGRAVVVFNVCGNDYRLITALHYNRKIVYLLRFMTHAEYSKEKWKMEL